jgi:putative two-component system response regulator
MVVDDNVTNLNACVYSLMDDFDVIPATSAEKMFKLLAKIRPDLILLDIEMPQVNGLEAMRRLKSDQGLSSIPVVFLTATAESESEVTGLELGALDYITKPFSRTLLLRRLGNYLELTEYRLGIRCHGAQA